MTRFFGIALCACLIVIIGATLVGRAIDNEVQTRVTFTRDGQTFDCERRFHRNIIAYNDCHTVQP